MSDEKNTSLSDDKLKSLLSLVSNIESSVASLKKLIKEVAPEQIKVEGEIKKKLDFTNMEVNEESVSDEGRIIEGMFNGQAMVGPDGQTYTVPPNYASKSKLVVGDKMKLTIQPDGSFRYKQIGPAKRKRIIGVLEAGEDDGYTVLAGGKLYDVLTASVTYFKGNIGDEVVILVPEGVETNFAAVENIIKQRDQEKVGAPAPVSNSNSNSNSSLDSNLTSTPISNSTPNSMPVATPPAMSVSSPTPANPPATPAPTSSHSNISDFPVSTPAAVPALASQPDTSKAPALNFGAPAAPTNPPVNAAPNSMPSSATLNPNDSIKQQIDDELDDL